MKKAKPVILFNKPVQNVQASLGSVDGICTPIDTVGKEWMIVFSENKAEATKNFKYDPIIIAGGKARLLKMIVIFENQILISILVFSDHLIGASNDFSSIKNTKSTMTAHLRRCWRRVAFPCMEKPRCKATASVISCNNYPMVFLEQLLNLIKDFRKKRKLFQNAGIIT